MLTQSERDEIGIKLTEIAFLYSYDLPKQNAVMFIDLLQKYIPDTLENYLLSLDKYISDSKNKSFPSPMGLKQYLTHELSPETSANEVAGRIREAVSKYGWSQPQKAKFYIGDLGWKVVDRFGGWMYLCENLGVNIQPTTFFAQARESAKSIVEANYKGVLDQPIVLDNVRKLNIGAIKEVPKISTRESDIHFIPLKDFSTEGEEVLRQIDESNKDL